MEEPNCERCSHEASFDIRLYDKCFVKNAQEDGTLYVNVLSRV